MPLTDTAIRKAKPGTKPVRLFDERGLYLEIAPAGGKWWRLKYRYDGKEKRLPDMRKLVLLCSSLVCPCLVAQTTPPKPPASQAATVAPVKIFPNARVYISPMDGFDSRLTAAFMKKKVPLLVVDSQKPPTSSSAALTTFSRPVGQRRYLSARLPMRQPVSRSRTSKVAPLFTPIT